MGAQSTSIRFWVIGAKGRKRYPERRIRETDTDRGGEQKNTTGYPPFSRRGRRASDYMLIRNKECIKKTITELPEGP